MGKESFELWHTDSCPQWSVLSLAHPYHDCDTIGQTVTVISCCLGGNPTDKRSPLLRTAGEEVRSGCAWGGVMQLCQVYQLPPVAGAILLVSLYQTHLESAAFFVWNDSPQRNWTQTDALSFETIPSTHKLLRSEFPYLSPRPFYMNGFFL